MNTFRKILGEMRKADEMFSLIKDGDRIAVGLSGGKDSTLLLYALHTYRYLAENALHKHFDVIGIHIDLHFGEDDFTPLKSYLAEKGIDYYEEKSQIYEILDKNRKNGRIQCSLCSTLKKGAVINAAKACGCNKVAFGHHADDAIETLFLNMIYGGRIATFDPKMYLTNSGITFIRPFCLSYESEIRKAVQEMEIPVLRSGCPNDGHTKREDIKQLTHQIYHDYPGSKENFLLSLYNHEKVNLFKGIKEANFDDEPL